MSGADCLKQLAGINVRPFATATVLAMGVTAGLR